jgi:hypothetical protein
MTCYRQCFGCRSDGAHGISGLRQYFPTQPNFISSFKPSPSPTSIRISLYRIVRIRVRPPAPHHISAPNNHILTLFAQYITPQSTSYGTYRRVDKRARLTIIMPLMACSAAYITTAYTYCRWTRTRLWVSQTDWMGRAKMVPD